MNKFLSPLAEVWTLWVHTLKKKVQESEMKRDGNKPSNCGKRNNIDKFEV